MVCDKCGTKIERGDFFRSRFTKKRYCKDVRACDIRVSKQKGKVG